MEYKKNNKMLIVKIINRIPMTKYSFPASKFHIPVFYDANPESAYVKLIQLCT